MRCPALAGCIPALLAAVAGTASAQPPHPVGAPNCLTPEIEAGLVRLHAPGSPIEAVIRPDAGGAMVGLERRGEGQAPEELLYRGMDFCETKGWDGKAPVLWPATGRSFAPDPGSWMWKGRRLNMQIHGFARDRQWRIVSRTRSGSVTVRLEDDADTRALYPFGFVFDLTYRIDGDRVLLEHWITADPANTDAMPFSIGNHVTFAVAPGAMVTTPATVRVGIDGAGKPTGEAEAIAPLHRSPIASAVGDGATSLTGYAASAAWLEIEQPGGEVIGLCHYSDRLPRGEAVLFNLWGKPEQGYFSPEPWIGRQDSLNSGQGLFLLPPGESMVWTVAIGVGDKLRHFSACQSQHGRRTNAAGENR